MSIIIGSVVEGASRPSFHASLDGKAAIVELDSGAMSRLGEHGSAGALARLLDAKRDMIGAAATRLIDGGFITRRDDGIEILITALDL